MSFRVTREREVYRSRIFTLKTKQVLLPGGRRSSFDIVEHPGAVAIVPLFDDGDVLLIRQFRVAVGGWLYEIPAGTREPGESPKVTASREIIEETGYRARSLRKVSEFWTVPGFCTEKMHLFIATGLSPAQAEQDEDEVIRPKRVPLTRAGAMIRSGEIRDAKTIVGISWALHHDR